MTLLERPVVGRAVAARPPGRHSRPADAATLVAIFIGLQFMVPSGQVVRGLPLSLSAAALVALCLGVLWLCTQLTTTLGAAKGPSPVRLMLFAYACTLLASYGSSSWGYLPGDERALGDHAMVSVFAMIFLGLAVCDGVRSRERIAFLLRVIVVCGTFVSVVAILQYLVGFDLTRHLRLPLFRPSTDSGTLLVREGLRRVAGTTAHPIEFGVFSAMLLPIAIHVAYRNSLMRRRSAFWWTCVCLIGAGLMFSVSRSAILGVLCAGTVIFLGWSGRRRVWMIVSALGFLVVIKFAAPGLLGAFLSLFQHAGSDDSVKWRTHDYATARQLISHHLLLGRGIGTWYAPKHEVFDNQYLLTLVESGVLGLVTFLGILFAALYSVLRVGALTYRLPGRAAGATASTRPAATTAATTAATDRDLALAIGASLVVVLPTYATFDFGAFPTVTALAYLLMGIAGAFLRVVSDEVEGRPVDPYAVV